MKKTHVISLLIHLVDAFIAMGGGPGKEGYIDAKKLIKVIKEDFEMTIDIEVRRKKARS